MKINEIKPFVGNAKKHDKTQVENVKQSIKEFGFVQPLVLDKNGVVIIGHCRLQALKELGYEDVPDEFIKVLDISETEANKLRLLDNKLNESDWDFDLLKEQVPEIDFSNFSIDWGFEEEKEEDEEKERENVSLNEKISVVIECLNDNEAEKIYNELSEKGYKCKISTL